MTRDHLPIRQIGSQAQDDTNRMIASIALTPIFGLPAIAYGGFATLILFSFVAVIGHRIFKGTCKFKNPIKVHQMVAILSFIFGVIHGVLGLSILLGF